MITRSQKYLLLSFLLLSSGSSCYSQSSSLFDSDRTIDITLKGDVKALLNDRGDDPQYHNFILSYQQEQHFEIPIKIKSRGHFRKMPANCKYPPLLLNFDKSATPPNSLFFSQDKLKLVTPCSSDEYVINEYLVYKLYNLISPRGFKARSISLTLYDTIKDKTLGPFFTYVIEEEEQMALRNHSITRELQGLRPESTQRDDFIKMAVFQYMIGNTDWSVQYQQNIKLIAADSSSLPSAVPYDFDHAGIVRAPYAKPAPELQLRSALQRRYRGYCMPEISEFENTFETFNKLKDDFYALYNDNTLISDGYQKQSIKFLDEFYETINDPEKARKAFTYPCDESGTGNVVIKGLKKH
jgi:hypothetical protein